MPTLLYLVWLLWTVNQHTFFGCKEISDTEDIRFIKIQQSFEPSPWSWPWKQSNFYAKTPANDDVPSSYIWLQKDQQLGRYSRKSHIWSNEPSLWPWTSRQQSNLLAWHFGPWCCITTQSLVTEGSAAEEILSRWTFTGILNLFCDLDLDHNRTIQSFHKTIHLMIYNVSSNQV